MTWKDLLAFKCMRGCHHKEGALGGLGTRSASITRSTSTILKYFHHLKYSQVSTTIVTPSECYRFTLYIFSTFPSLERGFKIVWYFALGLNKSRHICSFINSTLLAFLSLSCNLQVNWLRWILLMYDIQFTPAGLFFRGITSRCTELLCERVCK